MPQKMNNNRKYPNANHQPFHKAKSRKEDSLARQAEYDKLTVELKLQRLDAQLGVSVGAVRQRARLQKTGARNRLQELADKAGPLPTSLLAVSGTDETIAVKQTKKHMKGVK